MTHQAQEDKIGHPEEKLPEALGPWKNMLKIYENMGNQGKIPTPSDENI